LVHCYCPLSSRKPIFKMSHCLFGLLIRSSVRAQQASKNELTSQTNSASIHRCAVCFGLLICYVLTHLKSISILFTSKPIHELRLNQTVTNTVIALTIRVIYLPLIITLKRGVVVLWFTVTCPLSSGFLPTIIPAEQFLSPKTTKRVPHTHQELKC